MSDSLEKSASVVFREKIEFHEGILNPSEFARNYDLRCYEPSEDMAPFVEHYFLSRRRPAYDADYVGNDVLSQPVVSLFFWPGPGGAFFQGPITGKRVLIAKNTPVYAGVQFKPGGFHPFWRRKISELAEKTIPAGSVLPTVTDDYNEKLLAQEDDQQLLLTIETVLRSKQPQPDRNIALVQQITDYIEGNNGVVTVAAVADHFAVSERSLQHLFQTYVGVGVKWAIMRARFLEVTKYARAQEKPDWVAIAAEFGYSDQPHFVNDFKRLVGQSPAQYLATYRASQAALG